MLLYVFNGLMVFLGLLSAVGLYYYGTDVSMALVIGGPGYAFTALWGYFDTRAMKEAKRQQERDLATIRRLRQEVKELEAQLLQDPGCGDAGS
jgi:hypothetical protein